MRDGCPGCGELSCLHMCHSESCSPGFVVAVLAVWKLSQCLCESMTMLLQCICTESEVCTRTGYELYELLFCIRVSLPETASNHLQY